MSDGHTERLESALDGKYKIERKLGEGGMASVYLAADIKHERKVAVKVLRPELAAVIGAERFLSEIKTTANLQHPHILPLFDSGEAGGYLYYVMPFIDGDTLRERIEKEGQLGVDEAVSIARDVAEALDYAHRSDVIHRDIKPANILLHDGNPVVADFGIALAISAAGGGRMTETGLSLGTPHYMSPEQASADRDLSARSDVYSLGCVLYEMLAGQPPHTGPSAQSILVRILTEDPRPLSDVRRTVPPHIAATVMKSIEKLPADRFDSARQFMDALADATFEYTAAARPPTAATSPAAASPDNARPWLADARSKVAVAAIAILAVIGGQALFTRGTPAAPPPTVRAPIPLDADYIWSWRGPRISADGRRIMLVTTEGIMIRDVDQPTFRLMPGTENAEQWASLSADGDWVVFARDGDLFKISVTASSPITLVREANITAGEPHWGADGSIVFRNSGTMDIWRVSETGGDLERIGEGLGLRPSILPDGSGVLITTGSLGLVLLDLATGDTTFLADEALDAVYSPTGHILYGHPGGGLFALPFDLRNHEIVGSPIPVLDEVGVSGNVAHFDVSSNGTLVFTGGTGGSTASEVMVLLGSDGAVDTVRIDPRSVVRPRFSPDGGRLVFNDGGGVRSDDRQVLVYDLVLESLRQLSFDGGHRPVWSPDGGYIAYSSEGPGTNGEDLWIHPSDGASDPVHLALDIPDDEHSAAWPIDTVLVFETGNDLYVVNPFAEAPAARPYVEAEYGEWYFDLDPSGRFAAYATNEYNRPEVFVRDFPLPRGKWRISSDGGDAPKWSADGQALYYLSLDDDAIIRHELGVNGGVAALRSEVVWRVANGSGEWDYDPTSGRAVITVSVGNDDGSAVGTDVWIVVNWFEELRRLTGGGD